ncbi:MAG: L-serine ammonia-lyase, iron-sulfur-dependent, subunit alpha [Bacteroidales bacterium]|jgi:L-serine dehydratase|nr:L-serine ammonia-lyase, iron-sulfur-dependent, subunit alpha [Bacteroidales bacterium]MDD2204023.1 L-serine ammonia-lyase, iron-sulfur-dependent, subunit alpha [Bacteroidales bacterium]MDD3152211.1 L-serine ammonia-lyase, iron-sulfur-dependent, subunit alpha [Bacteroidales bacterium]MDD3913389.1 L-serine ammonia-lyase, iron-sulfur-dependent, subunit alpha [Bacteroidales bacterium]MDD4633184.1 L-serine ammonia-lyase, iron-sulfur-dependent, subunit alpha [Bacteroidales bacterium]
MDSIKKIYKIGRGPSSSHTMGPSRAAKDFLLQLPDNLSFKIILYGSLAATGKGHLTDVALLKIFPTDRTTIEWQPQIFLPEHPNAMEFFAYNSNNDVVKTKKYFSIGGGDISSDGKMLETEEIYSLNTMNDILEYIKTRKLWEYVDECEGNDVWDYLHDVWVVMKNSIRDGLEHESTLPGVLHLPRRASSVFSRLQGMNQFVRRRYITMAYAFAVAEENASGHVIVTAPTCGSCGVLPAALFTCNENYEFHEKKILHALATAGLIGNLIKFNASISGAEVGCQGEVGSACAMAAGAVSQLLGGSAYQIEYAAEMGLEHHLGLTCDPVCGLVQVPCIERNAFAAVRSIDAAFYSILTDGKHLISFDKAVKVMKATGHDLPSLYKETSLGGLAAMNH